MGGDTLNHLGINFQDKVMPPESFMKQRKYVTHFIIRMNGQWNLKYSLPSAIRCKYFLRIRR